jgi:hypothetical protein
MIYVNGDSHSTGAEIANNFCFAEDDPKLWALGRAPHPDNLKLSYGQLIADRLGKQLVCEAESGGSNDRVFRTTEKWLRTNRPDLLIIGWSTWEREEWLFNDTFYQVSASGHDSVPRELQPKYKAWVIEQGEAERERKMLEWHFELFGFHSWLQDQGVPHLFFNTYSDFSAIRHNRVRTGTKNHCEFDWNSCYIDPYDQNETYFYWLQNQGFKPVSPTSYHYGADAHAAWADHLMEHIVMNILKQT